MLRQTHAHILIASAFKGCQKLIADLNYSKVIATNEGYTSNCEMLFASLIYTNEAIAIVRKIPQKKTLTCLESLYTEDSKSVCSFDGA